MSADRGGVPVSIRLTLAGLAIGGGFVHAADAPLPDAAFLEYLGSWEGSDEDWLLFETSAADDPAAREDDEQSDTAPEGEDSPESNDEQ